MKQDHISATPVIPAPSPGLASAVVSMLPPALASLVSSVKKKRYIGVMEIMQDIHQVAFGLYIK